LGAGGVDDSQGGGFGSAGATILSATRSLCETACEAIVRILWINPVGTDAFDVDTARILSEARRSNTSVHVISLPHDRPPHLEYHAYESMVIGDIVRITYALSNQYDAVVIGCFYDVGLREAREVSGRAVVTAPCQSSLAIASQLGNAFSILVGRRKWMPKMRENVRTYGQEHHLASMRPLDLGVLDLQENRQQTCDRLLVEGRKCVEQDGAEVLILGCTAEYGFHQEMQEALGVPVIDAVMAPFKLAELLAETAEKLGWYPSRKWGSEAPPAEETEAWKMFDGPLPVGNYLRQE
jgi:allantoin racemase